MKPIIKWVGGKTQLLNELLKRIPTNINNYYEPFIGGGSVLLELLNKIEEGKIHIKGSIYAFDNNKNLIQLYNDIKSNPEELIKSLHNIYEKYEKCGNEKINAKTIVYPLQYEDTLLSKELFYYYIRQEYNKICKSDEPNILISTYFIFLNKTSFRGLYRVGPHGFNVPYGNYKNPSIYCEKDIYELSKIVNKYNVLFIHQSFEKLFIEYTFTQDDFIYFDPPYVPEKKSSFVQYMEDGFQEEKHIHLFEEIKKLHCNFLLSNSDVELLHNQFQDDLLYKIDKVKAKRSIQSNNPSATTYEVMIYKL